MNKKPLKRKTYGSIPHLPGSRRGPKDHGCHEGQARIATVKIRNKNDEVIVQEKLDGSNVGCARINGRIYPLGRAGYLAETSPYEQHHYFAKWAHANAERFLAVLNDDERLVGEWLMQAHGTKYELDHEPFVAFDLMIGSKRLPYDDFMNEVWAFITPHEIHRGGALSIEAAMAKLNADGYYGFHGATEPVEGAVWRVEHDKPTGKRGEKVRVVNFLTKYVRPDKVDGKYLPEITEKDPVWNWRPD